MAYERLGKIEGDLGDIARAIHAYEEQARLLEEVRATSPASMEVIRDLARAYQDLAYGRTARGDHSGAETAARRSIEEAIRLSNLDASDHQTLRVLARGYRFLGIVLCRSRNLPEAETMIRRDVKIMQDLGQADPQLSPPNELAVSLGNLAAALLEQGKGEEATSIEERAVALMEKALQSDPTNPEFREHLWAQYDNLACAYLGNGHPEKAQRHADASVAMGESLVKEYPDRSGGRRELGMSYNNLGEARAAVGRSREAEEAYRKAVAISCQLAAEVPDVPDHHSLAIDTSGNLGDFLRGSRRYAEARDVYRDALLRCQVYARKFPDSTGPTSREAALSNSLARLLCTCDETSVRSPSEAVKLASRAVTLSPKNASYWNTLGLAHDLTGDWDSAIRSLENAMELRSGGDASDWFILALTHGRKGHKGQARRWYDKAVAWMEKNKTKDDQLQRFRDEAAALLGKVDLPADVFAWP
jgi:tetratricopeptide (TPR) repeat protein